MLVVAALTCGFVFGLGLLISGMVQPGKVLGFLDIFGNWDPSLAVVMLAALVVASLGFRLAERRAQPILAKESVLPTKTAVDLQLVGGSVLFGIGWGLVGLCPGPALENLATFSPRVLAFVIAMIGGMALHNLWQRHWPPLRYERTVTVTPDG